MYIYCFVNFAGLTGPERKNQSIMANKLQITEEQNREMIKLMDDLNDRLEEKEHTIEALKSQAKSVSSLMKEIKRLEKIAGRKSYQESLQAQHEVTSMRCAELETKISKIISENALLNETIQALTEKHGALDEMQLYMEKEREHFENELEENKLKFEKQKELANVEIEKLHLKAQQEKDEAKKIHDEFIETSKMEHEKWIATSIASYQEDLNQKRNEDEKNLQKELLKKKHEHDKKLAKELIDHQTTLSRKETDHELKLSKRVNEINDKISKSLEDHERSLEESKKQHDEKLQAEMETHAQVLEEFSSEHAEKIENVRNEHEEKLIKEIDEHKSKLNEDEEAMRKKMDEELSAKKKEFEKWVETQKSLNELKRLKEEKAMEDEMKLQKVKVEDELKCLREAQEGVLQAERELCEKRNDEEILRCQHHAKQIIDEANDLKEKIVKEKEAHEEWLKSSKVTHEITMMEEREKESKRMKEERDKQTLNLAQEKEEHRKMCESIQMITYKNLELEREKIKNEWDRLEANKKQKFGGFVSAAIDSVVEETDNNVMVETDNILDDLSISRRSNNPFAMVDESLKKSQSNYHTAISSLELLASKDIQYYNGNSNDNSLNKSQSPLKSSHLESIQQQQQQIPRTFGNSLGSTFNSPARSNTQRMVSPNRQQEHDDDVEDCIVLEVDTANGGTEELRLFKSNNPRKQLEKFAKKHNMSNGQVRTILDYINSRFA